jgi:hypothetical protein
MHRLTKFFPIAIGLFLGVLALHPPNWLAALGPFRYAAMALLVLGLLIGFVALLIASNLPANITMRPSSGAVPPQMEALAAEYAASGFAPAAPLQEVGVSPPALLLPFVNDRERTYGTVFRTGTVPAKVAFDFFSYFEGVPGGLTSAAERGAGVLPAGSGALCQLLPGATVAQLFAHHKSAIELLRQRGLPMRAVSAGAFEADFRAAIARQRRTFLTAPLRNAAIAIWRAATRTTPHLGALEGQRVAQRQVAALLARRT